MDRLEVAETAQELIQKCYGILAMSDRYKFELTKLLITRDEKPDDALRGIAKIFIEDFINNAPLRQSFQDTLQDAVFYFIKSCPTIKPLSNTTSPIIPTVSLQGINGTTINIGVGTYKIEGIERGWQYVSIDTKLGRNSITNIAILVSDKEAFFSYDDEDSSKEFNDKRAATRIQEFLNKLVFY